ncbi:TadE/TadG family type IV pilus assembly protein [Taklimakanibacter lacteus]|uniref:TadE/TadG family type IV pilus assembly protein n=1 Tax=Taklimakanibacter lacteus TaxID=2268456 RepID=UPI000E670A2B
MSKTRSLRNFPAKLVGFLRDPGGVAAIEMAIIAPLLLLLYFGTVDVANWFMVHRRLVIAGSTLADLTTQNANSITGTQISAFWTATGKITEPYPIESITLTVRDFRVNGTTAKQQWQYTQQVGSQPDAPPPNCGAARDEAALQGLRDTEMTDANDIVVVEVCTSVPPIALQIIGIDELNLHYQIAMRPRLSKTIDCTSGCS